MMTTRIVLDKTFQDALQRYRHEGGSSYAVAQAAARTLATDDDILACKRVLTTFAEAMTIDRMPTALRLDMQQTAAVIARLERNRTDP
jgi:hypothetical protein